MYPLRMIEISRSFRWMKGAVVLMLLTSCATDPVHESVKITMLPKEKARISATVEIYRIDPKSRPKAAAHADLVATQLLEGSDAWSRRFQGLTKISEMRLWIREKGDLTKLQHSAVVMTDELGDFFFDTPLTLFVTAEGDERELTIFPGSGSRANREQKKIFDERLDLWLERVSGYYSDLASLYEFLQSNPGRKAEVARALTGEPADLTDLESALVEELDESLSEVMEVIAVGEDDAYSMQYLSRLIYDTLPARIEIVVSGDVTLQENFFEEGDANFVIEPLGLIQALAGLENRWITPDPLGIFLKAVATEEQSDDSPEMVWTIDEPIVNEVPSPATIRGALLQELERPRVYRLRWRSGSISDPEAPVVDR